jgi:ribosomal protein L28
LKQELLRELKWQPLGCQAHERKACGWAARRAGQRTRFGRDPGGLRPRWIYSKLNRNKTKKNRLVNIFSCKIYFTNKGQILILRVCVIADFAHHSVGYLWQLRARVCMHQAGMSSPESDSGYDVQTSSQLASATSSNTAQSHEPARRFGLSRKIPRVQTRFRGAVFARPAPRRVAPRDPPDGLPPTHWPPLRARPP